MQTMTNSLEAGAFMAVRAGSSQPIELAMQQLFLTGRILPVGGHLMVKHQFRSAEKKLLEVVYSFVLPRDAALRRFEVKGEGFAVRSTLKPVKQATEEYEKAIAGGHLGTLARQYRDGLINLSLGNLRPDEEVSVTLEVIAGVELRDDGFRFRFPFTLAPSYHAQARAAEVSPGEGEIELPGDLFGDLILPGFRKSAEGLHQVSFDLALEVPWDVEEIASPSHSLRVGGTSRVSLAPASDLPDRDLVLDVQMKPQGARVLAGAGEGGRRYFAAVIPSSEFGTAGETPRTAVLLLDRSGSMSGTPISQARKAAIACLAALGPEDQFGMIAFDDRCEVFRTALSKASPENRSAAQAFLDQIDARGGTELAAGIKEATGLLRESGGDVFILTDGQVFATEDILEAARATGCRLHTLGIGSASQDRFLALLARETNGISRFVTPRERVDQAALELFASVARPVATELRVAKVSSSGTVTSPDPPKSVFSGTPILLFGECDAGAPGSIMIEFTNAQGSASRQLTIETNDSACGETLRLIRGSRLITDAEARLGAGNSRENKRWEDYLTQLSIQHDLASRTMALVAVAERAGDKPGEPPKTQIVPVGLPQDMQSQGIFPPAHPMARYHCAPSAMPAASRLFASFMHVARHSSLEDDSDGPEVEMDSYSVQDTDAAGAAGYAETSAPVDKVQDFDLLMDLSIHMRPDGGMPGTEPKGRILATLLTLLAFLAHGHDLHSGAFRMHVKRMLDYLGKALPDGLSAEEMEAAKRVVAAVRAGRAIRGEWLALAAEVVRGDKSAAERGWKEL